MNIVISVSDEYAAKVCSRLSCYQDISISILQDYRSHSRPIQGCNNALIWSYRDIQLFHDLNRDVGISGMAPSFWISLRKYIPFFLTQTDRLSYYPLAIEKLLEIFYRYARLWHATYKEHRIGAVVFFATPHMGFDFVSYAVAEILGISVRIVNRTGLGLSSTISSSVDLWNQGCSHHIAPKPWSTSFFNPADYASDLSLTTSVSINRGVHAQHSGKIDYLRLAISFAIPTFKGFFKSLLQGRPPKTSSGRESFRWLTGPRDGLQLAYERFLHVRRTRQLLKSYYKSCTSYLPSSPYIFFAAHFQPERSTAPEGGCFDNQILALDSLLDCLPQDIHVIYKEHPRQFDVYDMRRKHARSADYYSAISAMPRVHLVDPFYDSSSLISGSIAVATVTGTSGWEAIKAGKPSIVFGDAWYKLCGACLHVSKLNSISLAKLIELSPDRIEAALLDFLEWAARSFINAPNTEQLLIASGEHHRVDEYSVIMSRALHDSFHS